MKVSREGIVLIKSFEGFRPRAVRDGDGRWIIGYGHSASAREGLTVGEQDAELLLQYDLLPVARALNDDVSTVLNQHQFDALASFAISVGVDKFLASDVLGRLNAGQAAEAADALMGWPDAPSPDAALRRRAAERALFIATPGSAVTLADLLSAPLEPFPFASVQNETSPADARAAAVAALLGETAQSPTTDEPTPVAPARPVPASPIAAAQLQRYSPYAATIVGPLPDFNAAASTPASLSVPTEAASEPVAAVLPEPEAGPFGEVVQGASGPEPVEPLVPPPAGLSPFPALDEESLVLTQSGDDHFVEADQSEWSPDAAAPFATIEAADPFGEESTASVMRHERSPAPPGRFDWSQTGMFLIMGGVGLVACASSAAAFRLALEEPSPMGETTILAWALAIIGVVTVAVSAWNLYARWGKPD